ncbi:hypothetical protein [Chitinophaga sp.]|uniref:DUF7710 domain-containing protein n=1 Tax=Chitinophaga sp. TaxID=1869181 RepID=UPI0031D9C711
MESVWLFNGETGRFASAVFTELTFAEDWVKANRLTGTLTRYPVNIGVYDWALNEGIFNIKKEEHTSPVFIGNFTSAGQEHYHYENGDRS